MIRSPKASTSAKCAARSSPARMPEVRRQGAGIETGDVIVKFDGVEVAEVA